MWTVIYIAATEQMAESIKNKLSVEGFLVKIRQSKISNQFEVLVPKGEVKEIRDVFATILP